VDKLAPGGNAAVTIMNHASQLLSDPQIRARGAVVESAGVPVPASPVRLTDHDGAKTGTATAAPHKVGEDTADILSGAGFSAEEIAALEKDSVI
jgi:crotonobetainyl-CoA:carnitine CoA-transferase CaiB-like acyl-CoA transferase